MNSSTYLQPSNRTRVPQSKRFTRFVASLFVLVLFAALTAATTFTTAANTASAEDEGFDPIRFAMCVFGKDSLPGRAYQAATTDDMAFAMRSKSSVTKGQDNVTSGLNWMLDASGGDFKKTNEKILGRKLVDMSEGDKTDDSEEGEETTEEPAEGETEGSEDFNKGNKVNPYDRFGVAGLNFSSYQGEWKYIVVEACNASAEPVDPKTGLYYDNRMVPQTTWEGINSTRDTRSEQMQKGIVAHSLLSFVNTLSNLFFGIAKALVAITIALINFAFADLVKVMGLDSMLTGSDGKGGVFGSLFKGLFVPFVVIIFVATAMHILWNGIVKRQYRVALTSFLRSIIMFFIAFVVAASPARYIAIPNNVAVAIQAVIVQTMSGGLSGGNGMCSTDKGVVKTKLVTDKKAEDIDLLAQASENMKSVIGCSMWQQFLLKPWVQGQFGVDWNQTWASGKTPKWADRETSSELTTKTPNAMKVAGNAPVPMGDGSFMYNWAIFQISTQSNVHSPVGHDGERSKVTSGVANDWWRIVDITSGYDERSIDKTTGKSDNDEPTVESYVEPDPAATPLKEWNTWIGDAAGARLLTALSAIFVAFVGVIAPLFFAVLSAIFSIGIAILMAFMPIMLLLGCWADRGWELFKAWGNLVVNTTLKRIACGVMLVLSVLFSAIAIRIMQSDSWWQGILIMMLLTYVLIKSRSKIFDAVASIQFSSINLGQTASRVTSKITGVSKGTGKTLAMGTAGGIASVRAGGGFSAGAAAGARENIRNMSYNNRFLRQTLTSYDSQKISRDGITKEFEAMQHCSVCGENVTGSSIIGKTPEGTYLCRECLEKSTRDDVEEMTVDFSRAREQLTEEHDARQGGRDRLRGGMPVRDVDSKMASANAKAELEGIQDDPDLTYEERMKKLGEVSSGLEDDIENHRERPETIPEIPDELREYINIVALEEAWLDQNYDYIREVYTVAWATWAAETFGGEYADSIEKILDDLRIAQSEGENA